VVCSYYIYYRVDPLHATPAEQQVTTLLALVEKSTGIAGKLLKKRGEPNLWMEVYPDVADPARFERELADAVQHLQMTQFLLSGSGRHIECFES
jgi:hypothetical protein